MSASAEQLIRSRTPRLPSNRDRQVPLGVKVVELAVPRCHELNILRPDLPRISYAGWSRPDHMRARWRSGTQPGLPSHTNVSHCTPRASCMCS